MMKRILKKQKLELYGRMLQLDSYKCVLAGLISLCAPIALFACTTTYPIVGHFDDYDEVFLGQVNHDLMTGTAFIDVKARNSGIRCTGGSHVTHVPASNFLAGMFLIPYCKGQNGASRLSCDDGRRIEASWTAESCSTGYGHGRDQNGARFQFAFGMNEKDALAKFEQSQTVVANKPEFPVYKPKEVRKRFGFSTGTSFLLSKNRYLLTNSHVIEDAKKVSLLVENQKISVDVIKIDNANDIALLKADITGTPFPLSSSTSLSIADEVMTLGYPLVSIQGQAVKASFGRINSLSGIADDPRFIQIDVPVQPGNSGGPLVNTKGELVGIVTMTLNQLTALRESGSLPQNVNYAVKADYIYGLIEDLEIHPQLGLADDFGALAARYGESVFLIVAE